MSKVVNFPAREVGQAFMFCSCSETPPPMAICVTEEENPLVLYLKCPACEQELPVTEGRVHGGSDE